MADSISCFFAYPSRPADLSEVIETAIAQINSGGTVKMTSWKTLSTAGNFLITEICHAISQSDIFACDLTYLNNNVLFELGYAIALGKRTWITLDPSKIGAKERYAGFSLLATVGYSKYSNSGQMVSSFYRDAPFNNLHDTLYSSSIEQIIHEQTKPILLYLKTEINTEASSRLSRRLQEIQVPALTDDPAEVNSQPLSWYVQNAYNASYVVAHLLDSDRIGSSLRNATYSFVSGLARGFRKPVLMLAHAPFDSPIDYRDLLVVHETALDCVKAIERWIPTIEAAHVRLLEEYERHQSGRKASAVLQQVYIGEYMAENEKDDLPRYFVETAAYREGLRTPTSTIFIGRKGAGKTANLYQTANELGKDPRRHVCVIRPVEYELEGILHLLQESMPKSERGYLIESLWKFLIYTELAKTIYRQVTAKPSYYERTKEEQELATYVESHEGIVLPEFTLRMEQAIRELCNIDFSGGALKRAKVSEILHSNVLSELRQLLGKVLERKEKVCVLIDNLDKVWAPNQNLVHLSDFLFGLLSLAQTISQEFQRVGQSWRRVNMSVIIFLRTDIFSYIMSMAREGDKIGYTSIDWNDPRLLQRVVEERFVRSAADKVQPDDVWQRFFCPTVHGRSAKDYLVENIVPRPRDIIYWCKAALAGAINHSHSRIEESDLLAGEREYSQHVFQSLVAECSGKFKNIGNLLLEFAGVNPIVTKDEILQYVTKAGIVFDKLKQTHLERFR